MASRPAIGNSEGVDAGSGPGGRFQVAVCGSAAGIAAVAADLGRLADAQPSLALDVATIATDATGPAVTASLIDRLPSAALAIVVAEDAIHLTDATRATALLAWRLTGSAPILAISGDDGGAASEWQAFAHDLGIPAADRAVVALDLLPETVARLAATRHQPFAPTRSEFADQVVAHIVWLGRKPMLPGRSYVARLGDQSTRAQIGALKHRVHPSTLEPMAARRLVQGDVGLCNVSFADPLVFDPADRGDPAPRPTSRFTLEDAVDGGIVGRGEISFTLRRATNIHWQAQAVDKISRSALKGHRPACLWFTGLSGSGKSTIATALEKRLNAMGLHTYTLDGDNVRHGLSRDLGFTDADRVENIRRIAEVAKLFVDAGLLVMVSFISPFRAERRMARGLLGADEFLEIFVDTPIEICEQRDPKGLYRKARAGELKNFTGIDSPYEPPEHAEIRIPGGEAPADVLVERILLDLKRRGLV